MKKAIFVVPFLFVFLFVSNSQIESTKTFKHNVLGFSIKYSNKWSIISVDDQYANLNKITLNDSSFNEMIKKGTSVPFFAISKFKEPYDDINPSLKINTKPYGNLQGKSLEYITSIMLTQFEKMFLDYKLIEGPKEYLINNNKSIYSKIYYTIKSKNGDEFKTCSELWLIDKGNYFYVIGVGTKQNESNCKRSEIYNFIKTIELK